MNSEKINILNDAAYKEAFELEKEGSEKYQPKYKAAFDHAKENRRFEIELYWKRATYFWTLIVVSFGGYFSILSGTGDLAERRLLAFAISGIGFVFTLAWFLVNRGSKQWQENWENHIDILEDKITGPLYKTVMTRPTDADVGFLARHVTGPAHFSVSKINQLINLFTMAIWTALCLHVSNIYPHPGVIDYERVGILVIAVAFCFFLWKNSATHLGDHQHVAVIRKTNVLDKTTLN